MINESGKEVGGRPRLYTEKEDLKKAIEDYFNSITITRPKTVKVVIGYEGENNETPIYEDKPVLNNKGEQVYESSYFENPSIIKMAHHIGMTRETLNQYSKQELFSDTIKEAKERIEAYLENELYRYQGQVTGVIFNLKNNFG